MKSLLLAVAMVSTVSAFAQTAYGPSDVCRRVSSWNASNGAACAQVISRARFDQAVVDVGYALANSGNTSQAVQVMQNGGNRRMDPGTARVCTRAASWNAQNAVACVDAALDATFDPAALDIAYALANAGNTAQSVEAMRNARNAYIHAGAARVCTRAASWNANNGAACVAAIANKDFFNGTESICYDLANSGNTNEAVRCLNNSGVQYNPYPPIPNDMVITTLQFNELQRSANKAQRMLDRGMIEEARRALIDLNRSLDEISLQTTTTGGGRGGVRGGGYAGGTGF